MLGRIAVGDPRPEDLQDHGHGCQERGAGHRPQRFRRRAHPGGRRLAGRLCRRLPAQCRRLGRRPADLGHHGPLRRRCGLFAGHDRLHLHGARFLLHVRHRPGRGEDGHQRDRNGRGTWRREDPHRRNPPSPTAPSKTTSRRSREVRRLFDFLPLNSREKPPARPCRRRRRTGIEMSLDTLVPDSPNKPYDMKELILARSPTKATSSRSRRPIAKNIVTGFVRIDGRDGRHRRQPADGAGRLPRHRSSAQGGALRALLRRLQHPDR